MRSNYERAIFDALYEEYEAMIPEITEEHIFSARFEKMMERLIKRRKKPYYKLISTGARRAACIVAAIIILSASALSVKAIREVIFDFFLSIFSNHTTIISNEEQTDSYPNTIEEEYYIEDLPEGFELVDHVTKSFKVYSAYSNNDNYIFLDQYTKEYFSVNFDNEQAEQSILIIDDQEYITFSHNDEYIFIWDNGEYIFVLHSNCDKNDIIKLCKSTKIKK